MAALERSVQRWKSYQAAIQVRDQVKYEYEQTNHQMERDVGNILQLLESGGFCHRRCVADEPEGNLGDSYQLTVPLGHVAMRLREVHCLALARIMESTLLRLSAIQLVAIFSCFTNVNVPEDYHDHSPITDDVVLQEVIVQLHKLDQKYEELEVQLGISSGTDYTFHYDLVDITQKWCSCATDIDCKMLVYYMQENKQISLGEFVKAILKINNIALEMQNVAEYLGDMQFLSTLREIPHLTLKYVVTNQSLYV
jgi:hypothetical protein